MSNLTPTFLDRFVAIDNVCAWPNLTLLPDGDIIATIFNQPSHLQCEGSVECWGSSDNGRTWQHRSTPAPHDPGTARGNVAAGLNAAGNLLVFVSGWDERPTREESAAGAKGAHEPHLILRPWVSHSTDNGNNWQIERETFPARQPIEWIPFSDAQPGASGTLGMTAYTQESDVGEKVDLSSFFRSDDDGRTWRQAGTIARPGNETALLHLGDGHWIAAARWTHLTLYRSRDNGETWQEEEILTRDREIPGHLLRLSDGRVLLTYGVRVAGEHGVSAKLSEDEGKSWSEPLELVCYGDVDGGYPSTVQTADGTLVTAYYCSSIPQHQRYHMGVVRWRL